MEHQNPQGDNSALLKDAFLLLERGDFAQADSIFNLIVSSEPENAMVYFGKLCAELEVGSENELCTKCNVPITQYSNYQMAMRYGSEKFRERLNGYNDAIINRLKAEELVRQSTLNDSFFSQVKSAEEDSAQQSGEDQPPAQPEESSPAYQQENAQEAFSVSTISRWIKKQPVMLIVIASAAVVLVAGLIVFFATRRTPESPVIIDPSGLIERTLSVSHDNNGNTGFDNELPLLSDDNDADLPHEHDWEGTNYQQPGACSICGQTGENLPASLAVFDDRIHVWDIDPLRYNTVSRDENMPISFDMSYFVYKLSTDPYLYEVYTTPTLLRPGIFEDIDIAEKDDYEWTLLHITFESVNQEANLNNIAAYGHSFSFFTCDYYTENMERAQNDIYKIGDMFKFTSNWFGENIEIVQTSIALREPSWNGIWSAASDDEELTFNPHSDSEPDPVFTYEILFAFYAPVYFDGVVAAFYNAENNPNLWLGEGESSIPVTYSELIDDDTLLIRPMA